MQNGDFSELLANRGSNLNSIPQLRIPQGFPGAGDPAPNNDMRPYITPTRASTWRACIRRPNYNDPEQPLQLRLQPPRAAEPHRLQDALRLEHQQQHQGLRPHRARGRGQRESPRGVWWGPSDVALPSPNIGTNNGRSSSRQRRVGAEPVDDQRSARQLQPADARQPLQGSERCIAQGAGGVTFNGIFPAGTTSPYLPTDLLHGWGGSGQVGNLWAAANDVYAHNDSLQFSDKLTKLMGAHGLKFGAHARARAEAAELPEHRSPASSGSAPTTPPAPATPPPTCWSAASASSTRAPRPHGNPSPGEPFGEFRFWNTDAFAQDSWKLQLEPDARIRRALRLLDEQPGAERPRRLLRPGALRPDQGLVPRSRARTSCSTASATSTPAAPRPASSPNRRRSRCRASTSRGTSTARATTSSAAATGCSTTATWATSSTTTRCASRPNAYQVEADFWAGGGYGNGVGPDLRHGQRGDARQPHRQHRHQHA